jgi:hypothetical protein
MLPPRPTTLQTEVARANETPHPEPVAPPVVLAGWFDRNGDGRIDGTTWLDGGDAFLPVGKDIAPLLDRKVSDPVVPAHQPAPVTVAPPASPPDTASSAPHAPVTRPATSTTPKPAPDSSSGPQQAAAATAYRHYGAA